MSKSKADISIEKLEKLHEKMHLPKPTSAQGKGSIVVINKDKS